VRPSDEARAAAAELWEAQHAHPFVRGIGAGTLDLARLGWWVRQDYLFLKDYVRVLALAAAKAPDLETVARFAALAHETAGTEMELHRGFAAEFGITPEQLEAEPVAPATAAYTDFLLRRAALGSYAELVAALLPCMWGFAEIGARLALDPAPADPRHAAWIDMYASEEFQALSAWCRAAYDDAAGGVGETERRRLVDVFVDSSRHELAFWEAAWVSPTCAGPSRGPAGT
jgi:thiaminase/transcriptional activator TenA